MKKKIIVIRRIDRESQSGVSNKIVEVVKNENKGEIIRRLLKEYLEYLYEYRSEFERHVNDKLLNEREKKYIYFNKQSNDYYINICSDKDKFGIGYCGNLDKFELAHVSFHIGILKMPLRIHIKCGGSTPLIIDTKLNGSQYIFSVNAQSNTKVYDNIITEFGAHHEKVISAENIISIVDGLFSDYQINKDVQNGGNGCYCIKCINEGDYKSIDYDNKFFVDFMNVIFEYINMVIKVSEQLKITDNVVNIKKQILKQELQQNKSESIVQPGGNYYYKYLKYKNKYMKLSLSKKLKNQHSDK